jgi:hypothetical protein
MRAIEWRAEKEEKIIRFFSFLELLRKREKRDSKEGFEFTKFVVGWCFRALPHPFSFSFLCCTWTGVAEFCWDGLENYVALVVTLELHCGVHKLGQTKNELEKARSRPQTPRETTLCVRASICDH